MCDACRVESDDLLPTEAFVLGLMIADLQRTGRRRTHATLCDRHGRFPHRARETTGFKLQPEETGPR